MSNFQFPMSKNKTRMSDNFVNYKINKSLLFGETPAYARVNAKIYMPRNKDIDKLSNDITTAVKKENISDGLSEIYQDDNGKQVDVSRLTIKKSFGPLTKIILGLFVLILIVGAGFGVWQKFSTANDITQVSLTMEGEKAPQAGKEMEYVIKVVNNSGRALSEGTISVAYPEGFVFIDATPMPSSNNNVWKFNNLAGKGTAEIRLRGRIYNLIGKSNLWSSELLYKAEGFSTEFKKNTILETVVSDSGLAIQLIKPSSVLKSEDQEIVIKYRQSSGSVLDNFHLTVEPSDSSQLEFLREEVPNLDAVLIRPWVWQGNKISNEEQELRVRFRFLDKIGDIVSLKFKFDYDKQGMATSSILANTSSTPTIVSSDYLPLYEEDVDLEVIKNDLSLLLNLNGQSNDQSVDFGQVLKYSINYNNVGDSPMEDVVISAVLEGDLLARATLIDKNKGEVSGQTITWSKLQIPELAQVNKGERGTIEFSIKVKNLSELPRDFRQDIAVAARFEMKRSGDIASILAQINKRDLEAEAKDLNLMTTSTTSTSTPDNYSNKIIARVNSDLALGSVVRYFSEDNMPLGSGPLPLEVAKTTSLKVFWSLNNTLHNLSKVRAVVTIPSYIEIADLSTVFGQLNYEPVMRQLVWEVPVMDKLSNDFAAQFTIKVSPTGEQRNQLLILLPAVKLTAQDDFNGSTVKRESKPKTSKLEDDDVAISTGIDLNGGLVK